jgi:two-component system, NarL family, sensor kinase
VSVPGRAAGGRLPDDPTDPGLPADLGDPGERPARTAVRRALLQHLLVSLVVFGAVAVGAVLWSRHLARDETLRDAARIGEVMATSVIAPVVTDALDRGDPGAIATVDRIVQPQVTQGQVLLVKIWRQDGVLLYATQRDLIGRRLPMEPDVVAAFGGEPTSDISSLGKAENAFDHRAGEAVEVYAPFVGPGGQQLLYETYLPVGRSMSAGERAVNREVLPLALTLLLVLQLVQLPVTLSLAGTVRRTEEARRRAVSRVNQALDAERRRLARFLHDEVVQDLAGVAYALGAVPAVLPEQTPDGVRRVLVDSGQAVRRDVGLLRGMLVDLYPARLAEVGLPTALEEQVRPLRDRGLDVDLDVDPTVEPDPTVAAVAFNVVREALRNVERHAGASRVQVAVALRDQVLRVAVTDDGRGFGPRDADGADGAPGVHGAGADGHVGLRLLHDSVGELGGTFTVRSAPGAGTTVLAELPRQTGPVPHR